MSPAVPTKPAYHHGDLRAALLIAAEAELAERGIEAFSLRRVALRAGVSHAAPAHHFGDATGMLTALAAVAFRRFLSVQRAREGRVQPAEQTPAARIVAASLGYVDFAMAHPAMLRLMFGSDRTSYADPDLKAAADAAYGHLIDLVRAAGGGPDDEASIWAMSHGLAELIASGRLKPVVAMTAKARDATLRAMITRVLPAPS